MTNRSPELGQLIEQHDSRLKNFIRAQIWNESDVEDIAQEIWTEVCEKYDYDPAKGTFLTWVKSRFAKYKIMQWQDRQKRRFKSLGSQEPREGEHEGPPDPAPVEPSDLLRRLESWLAIMRLLFHCGGYPHQQLAFALSRVIYGRGSDGKVRGDSQRFHEEHGGELLGRLPQTFYDLYRKQSGLRDDQLADLQESLKPLKMKLTLKVQILLEFDPHARSNVRKELLDQDAGGTCPRDYYEKHSGGYSVAIPDWSDKVKRRLGQFLGTGKDCCPRCKLRHVPPCEDPAKRDPPVLGFENPFCTDG